MHCHQTNVVPSQSRCLAMCRLSLLAAYHSFNTTPQGFRSQSVHGCFLAFLGNLQRILDVIWKAGRCRRGTWFPLLPKGEETVSTSFRKPAQNISFREFLSINLFRQVGTGITPRPLRQRHAGRANLCHQFLVSPTLNHVKRELGRSRHDQNIMHSIRRNLDKKSNHFVSRLVWAKIKVLQHHAFGLPYKVTNVERELLNSSPCDAFHLILRLVSPWKRAGAWYWTSAKRQRNYFRSNHPTRARRRYWWRQPVLDKATPNMHGRAEDIPNKIRLTYC
jgi:hypothetical protein